MRSLASGASTALASPAVDLAVLVEMAFSPVLYLATSAVPIVWGGNTYLAAGSLGAIEDLRDSAGDSQGVKFAISGIPTESIALVLGTSARNKRCILRLAILNADTKAIEDVSTLGTFLLDQMSINEAGATSTISVTAHPMARVFGRPKPLRYTDGDQQLVSPGDRCLEFISSQATHQDVWPAASWGRK